MPEALHLTFEVHSSINKLSQDNIDTAETRNRPHKKTDDNQPVDTNLFPQPPGTVSADDNWH